MSRLSPQPDQSKQLEKSRTQQGLNRTPSNLQGTANNNSMYMEGDVQRTEKKRSAANLPYQAPVLMEQNRQLLAENREMAMVIVERNQMIERLEVRYRQKVLNEQQMLQTVALQKQRLVAQVLGHQQKTQGELIALQDALSRLADEKQQLEIDFNRDRRTDGQRVEQERKLQVQALRKQYQENITVLQSENNKLRNENEMGRNQLQLLKLQRKQEGEELRSETIRVKEEVAHMEHLRRLEQAQLKHYYENKIQKLHLDHRRDKELFLAEHQSQTQRMQEEVVKLKALLVQAEERVEKTHKEVAQTQSSQESYVQKIEVEIRQAREVSRLQLVSEKRATREILEAQHEGLLAASEQQFLLLQNENQRLSELLITKSQTLQSLYAEMDALRERYCSDLQQHEKVIAELAGTVQSNELAHQEISQVLKAKLGCLRQADLKALRSFYEQQLCVLNQRLTDKELALAAGRQKYHNELRLKSEMRQAFDLQVARLKAEVRRLDSCREDLQAQVAVCEEEIAVLRSQQAESKANQDRYRNKGEQLRGDELQQLQGIINAKDKEIEQLEHKLGLLKEHQESELRQKEEDVEQAKQLGREALEEKQREVERLVEEAKKLRSSCETEKAEFEQNVNGIKQQHAQEIDKLTNQLNSITHSAEQQIRVLKGQNRSLSQQVVILTRQLQEMRVRAQQSKEQVKEQLCSTTNVQKQRLQQFYLQLLKQKQTLVLELKQRNQQLNSDLIDARENYQAMEQKIEQLMQAQGSLRELERKVMHLGKENNVVKNLRELYK